MSETLRDARSLSRLVDRRAASYHRFVKKSTGVNKEEMTMAKGYFMITEDIKDQDGLNAYSGKALPTILQSGGKPIIVSRDAEVLEGKWHGTQTIVVEFESVDAARAWYNSDTYQAVIGLRHAAADSNAVIVSGFEMPGS